MKPLLTGTRSIHEILSTFGNAGMLASAGITSPVAFWAILISGFGLTLRNIIAESKEETTLEDLAERIEELAAAADPSLSEGLVSKPADMALAFEGIPEMRALPAWGMPFDDIRRPWLLLVQWLDAKFKSAASDSEAIDQVLLSLREGLDTRLAILTAEQRELFTHRSKEVTDHVNAIATVLTQKLAAVHDDVLENRRLDGEAHVTTHLELKEIKDRLRWQPHPPATFQNIPHARRGDFTGREDDLQTISARLAHLGGGGVLPFVLHGPPGVGKTTLACEILHRLHTDGSLTHVLHVPADDPSALTSLLEALATRLHLVPSDREKVDTAVALGALHAFLQSAERKVLLFFDNADSPASIEAVANILQAFGHPPALVTSRRGDWPEAHGRPLGLWTEAEAAGYLDKRLPLLATADRELLVISLGGLPIAFDLAVGAIKRFHLTTTELIERWKTKLTGEKISIRGNDYTVEALLAVSLESLEENSANLLFLLAQFAPRSIPLSLLEKTGQETLKEDLATLEAASLVAWEAAGIVLHPFLREILLQMLPADARIPFFAGALELLAGHLPDPRWTPEGWKEWPILLPHAVALAEHPVVDTLTVENRAKELELLNYLLSQSGAHHYYRAAYNEAEPLMIRALKFEEASYGESHPRIADDLNNLAQLFKATNRLREAEPLMRRALAINEGSYGKSDPRIAIELSNLALLLHATNRVTEAEPLIRRALEINTAVYGENHPDVARDLTNLATFLQTTNHLAEGEALMRRALEIDEEWYGEEHPIVAARLGQLASILKATNRLEEAEQLVRRALRIHMASYGEDHPNVAADLNNLAQLLKATKRWEEAETLMRRAQEIDEATYGKQHPIVAIRLSNLATLLQTTNRSPEAERMMRRALEINEDSYGKDHPNVAIVLCNLASLLKATNRLAEAEPLMRRALAIDEASYGKHHPMVAIHLNNLASLLFATNRLSDAEPLSKRHLAIFAEFGRLTGHNHPHFQSAIENYAALLHKMGFNKEEIHCRILSTIEEPSPG